MKKKHFYTLLLVLGLFLFINPVMAVSDTVSIDNPCSENGIKLALQIIGYAIFVTKIVVPIILIVYGTIDISKAVIQGNDALQKNLVQFAKRCIAAILVFMAPGVINGIFILVADGYKEGKDKDYNMCFKCLFEPNSCPVQKYGETKYGE